MRILQLCHKPPLPAKDGGCIAMNNLTKAILQQGHEVKVLAMTTHKHPVNLEQLPEDYKQNTQFESVFVNTQVNIFSFLKSWFLNRSYYIERFISKQFEYKIKELLQQEQYDIILLESIFVAPYIATIKQNSNAKIVLRTHNIEFQIWERLAKQRMTIFKKVIFSHLARKLKRVELATFENIDGYMAISQQDYNYFHKKFPQVSGIVLPFGLDIDDYDNEDEYMPSENPKLFHIGSLAWKPNLEGIEWFLDDVWEEIHENFPTLTFTLAGRAIPDKIAKKRIPNVKIVGEVEDANEFMSENDIMIVPILSGSGIRVKIIEGMALGKAIITTTIGAEGLTVENEKHLFIADSPKEFIYAIARCIKTPDICTFIGENAKNFVTLYHNNDVISEKMGKFFTSILAQK